MTDIPKGYELKLTPAYTVELIAKNNSHSYRVRWTDRTEFGTTATDTERESIYPGVTGTLGIISKPALVNWAVREALRIIEAWLIPYCGKRKLFKAAFLADMLHAAKKKPEKLKDDAADLGTKAHAYIDVIVKGGAPGKLDNDILRPVSAFAEWWRGSKITLVLGDTKVASRRHGYGGSLDALGWDELHQCLVLLDWKTSKSIYEEYALQVAAYVRAFEEMYGVEIKRALIVRFEKDGGRASNGKGFEVVELRNIEESFQAFLAAKSLSERMKFEHLIRDEK